LDDVEVGSLTFGETILSVKLKLGDDDGVLSPAMHVERSLGHDEGSSVRDGGVLKGTIVDEVKVTRTSIICLANGGGISECIILDDSIRTINTKRGSECVKCVGKGINGITVVKGLCSEDLEKGGVTDQGSTVVDVCVGLYNPDEFLTGVVEVELDLVGRGSDGLVASELELSDKILVRVLCESATFVGVKEQIINV